MKQDMIVILVGGNGEYVMPPDMGFTKIHPHDNGGGTEGFTECKGLF